MLKIVWTVGWKVIEGRSNQFSYSSSLCMVFSISHILMNFSKQAYFFHYMGENISIHIIFWNWSKIAPFTIGICYLCHWATIVWGKTSLITLSFGLRVKLPHLQKGLSMTYIEIKVLKYNERFTIVILKGGKRLQVSYLAGKGVKTQLVFHAKRTL